MCDHHEAHETSEPKSALCDCSCHDGWIAHCWSPDCCLQVYVPRAKLTAQRYKPRGGQFKIPEFKTFVFPKIGRSAKKLVADDISSCQEVSKEPDEPKP